MSRYGHPVEWVEPPLGAALVGRFALGRGTRYRTHTHPTHQLVWARSGVVTVGVGDTTWVLPPSRALFVPAEVAHTTAGASVADLHSLYLRPERCPPLSGPPVSGLTSSAGSSATSERAAQEGRHRVQARERRAERGNPTLWTEPTVLAASPMFAALVGHLSGDLPDDARGRAEAVMFDVLQPAPVASAELAWPTDDRARRVADALAADPADGRDTASWARVVGTSERTLSRLFVAETGVGFGRWRTRLRVRRALELLGAGTPVAVAGRHVGYGTASAFIAAFRREVGVTPSRCFSS